MFRDMVFKELLGLLLSLRVVVTAVLVIALMTVSAVLFVDGYRERQADYQSFVEENLDGLRKTTERERGALFNLFSFRDQRIYRAPNPLAFLAEGGSKDLPNALSVDAFILHSPENLSRKNPLLWRFRQLDWAFIVMVVLSFAALVLAYDGVSGEREAQMMRLVMAQPVRRHTVILAKYAGTILCLLLLLLVGMLVHLAILSFSGVLELSVELAMGVGMAALLSGIYLSIFVLLGLLVSSRCRESATSLVICLLTWALLVVIIPNLGGLLASGVVDLPGPEEVADRASKAFHEARELYDKQHEDPMAWAMSGNWSPGEPLARAVLADEARERVYLDYLVRMLTQVQIGRNLTRVSPAAVYRYGIEALAGSGLEHFAWFLEQARHYRQGLKGFLMEKYPLNPEHPYGEEASRKATAVKVAFAEIPKFQDRLQGPAEGIAGVMVDGLLLVLWGMAAFGAAWVSFLRCDVR